jgi:hypothetical protein
MLLEAKVSVLQVLSEPAELLCLDQAFQECFFEARGLCSEMQRKLSAILFRP